MSSGSTPKGVGRPSKKKGGAKRGPPKAGDKEPVSLVRNPELGMNPRSILTGFYGSRGERIRHSVHDGALRLPKEALDLIERAIKETGLSSFRTYQLPDLDSVIRPSIDPNLESFIITELALEKVPMTQRRAPHDNDSEADGEGEDPIQQHDAVQVLEVCAENRTVRRVKEGPERIRGGGGDDEAKIEVGTTTEEKQSIATCDVAPGEDKANPLKSTQPDGAQSAAIGISGARPPEEFTSDKSATYDPAAVHESTPEPVPANANAPAPAPAPAQISKSQPTPPRTTAVQAATSNTQQASVSTPAPPIREGKETLVTPNEGKETSTTPTESSTTEKVPSTSPSKPEPLPRIQRLSTKPAPQWEQHKPGPNDETVSPADQLASRPSWYKMDAIADIERSMLPEWFNSSSSHRTPDSYLKAREKIIAISDTIANRNVTNTMIRRCIVGDAGSLYRLRNFLVSWGIINEDAINDSWPTPAALREEYMGPKIFDDNLRDELLHAVVHHSKRRKIEEKDSSFVPIINWEEIALQVGHGVTASDCERNFLSMPLNDSGAPPTERSITPDVLNDVAKAVPGQLRSSFLQSKEAARQDFVRDLIDNISPEVIRKVSEAAFQATDVNLKETQSAAVMGLVASRGLLEARENENELTFVLEQLIKQRMEKLENRMAMMDDIEAILEAEKVALELERRDLYTARCRHWFGGA